MSTQQSGEDQPAQQPAELHVQHGKKVQPFPLRVRIIQMCFLVVAVLATIGLAIWQWERFTSAQGDFQNLGYALQWPIFGGFIVFAYFKYMQYERERLEGEDMAAVPKEVRESMREVPDDFMELPGHRAPTDLQSDVLADDRRKAARKASRPPRGDE